MVKCFFICTRSIAADTTHCGGSMPVSPPVHKRILFALVAVLLPLPHHSGTNGFQAFLLRLCLLRTAPLWRRRCRRVQRVEVPVQSSQSPVFLVEFTLLACFGPSAILNCVAYHVLEIVHPYVADILWESGLYLHVSMIASKRLPH